MWRVLRERKMKQTIVRWGRNEANLQLSWPIEFHFIHIVEKFNLIASAANYHLHQEFLISWPSWKMFFPKLACANEITMRYEASQRTFSLHIEHSSKPLMRLDDHCLSTIYLMCPHVIMKKVSLSKFNLFHILLFLLLLLEYENQIA